MMANQNGQAPQNAPFRASIPRDADWKNTRPSASLAAARKPCPNGRILLAFNMEAIRDYFVIGHADQEAQAELNNAPTATDYRGDMLAPTEGLTLEQSFVNYSQADAALKSSTGVMERLFNQEIWRLGEHKDFIKACALLKSMPPCAMRHEAGSRLYDIAMRHGEPNIRLILHRETAEPYNWDRANALRDWKSSIQRIEHASTEMSALLRPLVEDFEKRFDRDGLMDLIAQIPDSIPRAIIMDKLEYDMAPSQHALFSPEPAP